VPAAALIALFVVVERRRAHRALLDPAVFTDRTFRHAAVLFLLLFASIGGYALTYAYFLQTALGLGPLQAALMIAPSPLGSVIGALWSDRVARWWNGRGLSLGLVVLAVTVAGMAATVALTPARLLPYALTPLVFASGLSLGLVTPGLLAVMLDRVASGHAGSVSGAVSMVQQVARALGVAAVGSLFFAVASRLGGGAAALTSAYAWTLAVLTVLFALAAGVLIRLVRIPARAPDAEQINSPDLEAAKA
jgi:MFS family permease